MFSLSWAYLKVKASHSVPERANPEPDSAARSPGGKAQLPPFKPCTFGTYNAQP